MQLLVVELAFSRQPTLEDLYRMAKKVFEVWDKKVDKLLREYKED